MQSRRTFIGAAITASAVALAGCSGSSDNGSDAGQYADLVVETEQRPVVVVGQKMDELAAVPDYEEVTEDQNVFGSSASDVEYAVNVTLGDDPVSPDSYGTTVGSFEYDALLDDLEGNFEELREVEAVDGFETIEGDTLSGTFFYGTDEDAVAFANNEELYESVTATAPGDGTLLYDASDDFATVADIIGDPNLVFVLLEPQASDFDPTGDAVAEAGGIEVSEGESELTAAVAYESESAAADNESAVEETIVENQDGLDSVETEVDGRAVVATGSVSTDQL